MRRISGLNRLLVFLVLALSLHTWPQTEYNRRLELFEPTAIVAGGVNSSAETPSLADKHFRIYVDSQSHNRSGYIPKGQLVYAAVPIYQATVLFSSAPFFNSEFAYSSYTSSVGSCPGGRAPPV